ncbi:transcriptional regulator [Filobacillus milosensis]|uniref:HTH-type transcriptional regulator n=1 Tax=Filobacillus milosensis TaxID=94137 RepID=A0A4Y8IG03_9BACI|nr:transcriptional regulator [Filobacillus milosensis]TFB19609.1 transcriptional regulator [Filobacillus milosensis]
MSQHTEKLQESQDVIVSAIAQSMVIYGVTPSVGRIYGVLYFSEEPMTLDEIKDQVAMSKASVSNGIRELMETEMVTKVWKKGERKDHFIAEKDFLKNFLNFFVKMIRLERSLISKAIDQTEPTIEEISKNPDSEDAKRIANRDLESIGEAKEYLDWIMRLANTLESREIFNCVPKEK